MLFSYASENWLEFTLEKLPEFVVKLDKLSSESENSEVNEGLISLGLPPIQRKKKPLIQEILEDVLSMATPQTIAFENALNSKIAKAIAVGYKWEEGKKQKYKDKLNQKVDEKIEKIKTEKLRNFLQELRSL